ncbi:MAG: flagellar motor protein MotB [Candidatus Krumholzibacteria bacterium]|nr:flagellar motor protein MotB [Candidatus Krumholzibacteria bacterium]MDP6669857.1 flagellar motor protein MotB [Candidatus Krumholzibacteria bacterium]MDP7020946.1 flagellar motor protein MotB [Candidatus Krumholzibacteria bacterium]
MNRKRERNEDEAGSPAWLATFGDMMTLLLGFFVLLYSFSSLQESKFHDAISSLKGALGVLESHPNLPLSPDLVKLPDSPEVIRQIRERSRELEKKVEALKQSDEVIISRTEKGLAIRLDSNFLFDLGKAHLRQAAHPMLEEVKGSLINLPNAIRVEGHTDDLPINTAQYPSNWELSAARASAIVRFFEERGVDPRRMSAAGLGEWRPVVKNDSASGRQKNRRVEIFLDLVAPDAESGS